jgi:hypothetical protein
MSWMSRCVVEFIPGEHCAGCTGFHVVLLGPDDVD